MDRSLQSLLRKKEFDILNTNCGSQKVLRCDFPDDSSNDRNKPKGVWCQEEGNTANYYIAPR